MSTPASTVVLPRLMTTRVTLPGSATALGVVPIAAQCAYARNVSLRVPLLFNEIAFSTTSPVRRLHATADQ
jgi:hypothetical protein